MGLLSNMDFDGLSLLPGIREKINVISGIVSKSFSVASCGQQLESECRDPSTALSLKIAAIFCILTAGVVGISIPLFGKKCSWLHTDGNLFFVTKAFAAGVILATGFVHMLSDGQSALTDSCLPTHPWSDFPFSSAIAMTAALMTLVADFAGTQYYQRKHTKDALKVFDVAEDETPYEIEVGKDAGGEDDMHIIGIPVDTASLGHHHHPHGHRLSDDDTHSLTQRLIGHSHGPSLGHDAEESHVRHVVVSQVLELGIVSHSVIIGLSLGVSQSPCTIRPLMGALCFHQFFEGFALGGCILQAKFSIRASIIMACFFAVTTPAGILLGILGSSFYDADSAGALIVEGSLDSVSAGILIYMALVDLIAQDFLNKLMGANRRLQVFSFLGLFTGAALMALLAVWA